MASLTHEERLCLVRVGKNCICDAVVQNAHPFIAVAESLVLLCVSGRLLREQQHER